MTKPELHEDWIEPFAKRIVQSLQSAGYETYLVGGCVRDLLAGLHPKDFDIATSALPNDIRRKVPQSYVIGKRFRLVLVKRGDHQFEVATFRRNVRQEELEDENNTIVGDNYFGTCQEDAQRRDFTINALFYDPVQHKLIDFVEGQKDIEARLIRMIGEPKTRFIEDPIRILRALRLSHKLAFSLEEQLRAGMIETAGELKKTALPRRREEYLKILRLDEPGRALAELFDLGLLGEILPSLHELYKDLDRVAIFETLLHEIPRVELNQREPVELFSGLLYSFLRSLQPEGLLDLNTFTGDGKLQAFIKDELGMFRLETTVFEKCLELIPQLERVDSYKKKGQRRQIGFLRNESLPLALKLTQLDRSLPFDTFWFWIEELRRHSAELVRLER